MTCAAIAALAGEADTGGSDDRKHGVAVLKPAQTGTDVETGDLEVVRGFAPKASTRGLREYPEPLAPDTAARRSGIEPVSAPETAAAAAELEAEHELVLIEGAGGLLVRFDESGATLADVAWSLGAPVLIVAGAGLGTLNHTALTARTLTAHGVHCLGVVIGDWPAEPGLAERCNVSELPDYAGAPLLGVLPEGMGRLSGPGFLEAARAGLSPWFGGEFNASRFAERYAPDARTE